jgi:hypothetical protein
MESFIRLLGIAGLVFALFFQTHEAQAGTSTVSSKATATITSSCTVAQPDVVFGQLNTTTYTEVSTNMTVTCTNKTTWTLTSSGSFYITGQNSGDQIHVQACQVAGWIGAGSTASNCPTTNQAVSHTGSYVYSVWWNIAAGYYTPDNYSASRTQTITY